MIEVWLFVKVSLIDDLTLFLNIVKVLFTEADKDESGVLEPSEIKGVIKKICERDGVECPSNEEGIVMAV